MKNSRVQFYVENIESGLWLGLSMVFVVLTLVLCLVTLIAALQASYMSAFGVADTRSALDILFQWMGGKVVIIPVSLTLSILIAISLLHKAGQKPDASEDVSEDFTSYCV